MTTVTQTSQKGLKHEFTVTTPKNVVNDKEHKRLLELVSTSNISGFRPGKAPLTIIKQRYGESVRAEAVDQTVSEAVQKVLSDNKLRPAMQPQIEMVSMGEDKDIEFKLSLEVLPEVTIGEFASIAIERPTAEVDEKAIDEAVERIAKNMLKPTPVTDGRAAKEGDTLVINFDGTVDGEARPGMKGENHNLLLGSGSFIDTFEQQLVGTKPGDKKTVKVTFPDVYHAPELAGKDAEFAVEVTELREPRAQTNDDAMAKELGLPSYAKLRERVKDELVKSYTAISRSVVKRKLMDILAEKHHFEVPESMLAREFDAIWKQVKTAKLRGDLPEEDASKSEDELKKEYTTIAERRIRLGLLLAEIARENKIDVHEKELRNALIAEVQRFPGQEKAVFDYYTQTEGAIEQIRAPLLEEKVVDHILKQIKLTDSKVSAEELLKLPEEMA